MGDVKYKFFLGHPRGHNQAEVEGNIRIETKKHKDIILLNMNDGPHSSAKKTRGMIKNACNQNYVIDYFFKFNDDVMLRWELLIKTLRKVPKAMNIYLGNIMDDEKIERNFESD